MPKGVVGYNNKWFEVVVLIVKLCKDIQIITSHKPMQSLAGSLSALALLSAS
jgi:hypothetical protein